MFRAPWSPPVGPPPPPPLSAAEALRLHHRLDVLDSVDAFLSATTRQVERLLERLIAMQTLAEQVADHPGDLDDREVAFAKINLFAHQCDVLAQAPVYEKVPVLEGGVFDFELPEAGAIPSEVFGMTMANLRSRGDDGLGLFEHLDGMMAVIEDGGRLLSGREMPVTAESPDAEALDPLAGGRYIARLTYLEPDASRVRLEFFAEGAEAPMTTLEIDLSPDSDRSSVDLGVGLGLVFDRIPRAAEIEIGLVTEQTLEWRRETGERLASIDGWFYGTVHPRDFEIYALFLEEPIREVRDTLKELESMASASMGHLSTILARLSRPSSEACDLLSALHPGGRGWNGIEAGGLVSALSDEI